MAYGAVYVFGDSLVDSGNVLRLVDFLDDVPFVSEPDGAPTAAKGYYDGRFTNGFNFADLITNKFVLQPSKPVFPFGYEDPYLGITFPFEPDPSGNNLNFAYGGSQIRGGNMPLDDQTDAYKDAIDKHASASALHLVTIGGNDVRELVPANGAIADTATAETALQKAAQELYDEMAELVAIGARNFVVTGIPDVGSIPYYNGLADEAARRSAATQYAALLDGMIQTRVQQLQATYPAVQIRYVSLTDATAAILANLAQVYDPAVLFPLNESELVFYDSVHPTAQAHALLAASMLDAMNVTPAGEMLPLTAADFGMAGTIGVAGEVDRITISLAANVAYRFELLGLSSGSGSLADPTLRVVAPGGTLAAANDDGGLGLDAAVQFSTAQAGDHVLELAGVGALSGSYRLQVIGDATGDNTYFVSTPGALVLEAAGEGYDTVLASVSYSLAPGASVERLATSKELGTTAINLTGNEVAQTIVGNAGNNVLDGSGGNDALWGKAGKDMFAFTAAPGPGNVDTIFDFLPRDDTITLENAVFAGLPAGWLAKGAFATGTAARQSDDRIIFDPLTGHLYFDPDGTGAAAQVHFATLVGDSLKVTASDFLVI
jgi:phospholipase/lecithinase/hemolysin